MRKERSSQHFPAQNPGFWLIERSRRYLGVASAAEFAAHVRADIERDISPAGNAKVTSDLLYATLFEGGERGKLAERLLVIQLGERNEHGFFPLGRFDRPALTTTVITTLRGQQVEVKGSKPRNSAKVDAIMSLVEPYLLRDKKTQTQLIDACKGAGISCAAERYTTEESAVYDSLEKQLTFFNQYPTFGINLAEALLPQSPLTITCGFDRLVGEGFLDPARRGDTSGLHILIKKNPQAPQIDDLEQFLQIYILCDYNPAKAAGYCGISLETATEYSARLLQEKRIAIHPQLTPGRNPFERITLDDFFVYMQMSGHNIKAAATHASISYNTAKHYARELVAQGRITLDDLRTRNRASIERTKLAAQRRYEIFKEVYAQTDSRAKAASAAGISMETARQYIYRIRNKTKE